MELWFVNGVMVCQWSYDLSIELWFVNGVMICQWSFDLSMELWFVNGVMMMMISTCTRQTHLLEFFSASSLRQQSTDRHMLHQSDTLSWFRANPYLLFLLNAACLVERQQISIALLRLGPNKLRQCPQDLRNFISALLYFQ